MNLIFPTARTRIASDHCVIHPTTDPAINPLLEDVLRYAVAIGAVLLLLLPAARGHHASLGWLPLWLLAMPLSAWWALHRFRLPQRMQTPAALDPRPRRRPVVQARRRPQPRPARSLPRAA